MSLNKVILLKKFRSSESAPLSFVIYKELIFNFDVITNSGDIIVGRRNGNGKDGLATPNPTLIGGKDPEGKEEHLDKAQELQESFPWVDIIN